MGKTKRSAYQEKKDKRYAKLEAQISEQLKEIKQLRLELKQYKDTGTVPVVKEKAKKPTLAEDKEQKKEEILKKMREWRKATHGEYSEE